MNQRHLALLAALLAPAALAACAGPIVRTSGAGAAAAPADTSVPAAATAAAAEATPAAADAKAAAVDTAATAAKAAETTAAPAMDLKTAAADTASAAASATTAAATTAAAPAATQADGAAVAAAGAPSIEQLFRDRATLGGKEVAVRGTVVKFKAGIMGKNWLHIQDGTGAPGTNDLTVTTASETEVGKKVLVKGVAAVNKDFGYGYKYDLIIEDAALTAE